MGYAAMAMQAAGAITSAYGSLQQGDATRSADSYNANVAVQNGQLDLQKANLAGEAGEVQAGAAGLATRNRVASITANQAAGNITVNDTAPGASSSAVRGSQAALGMTDALNIRANAARQAFGYQTEASSQFAQGQLDEFEGASAQRAGELAAFGSILSGSAQAAQMGNFATAPSADASAGSGSVDSIDSVSSAGGEGAYGGWA